VRPEDPWAVAIGNALGDQEGRIRAAELWRALGVPPDRRTWAEEARLGRIMRTLGWQRAKIRALGAGRAGRAAWHYRRGRGPQLMLISTVNGWRVIPQPHAPPYSPLP